MYLNIDLKLISQLFAFSSIFNGEGDRFIGLFSLIIEHTAGEADYRLSVIVALMIYLNYLQVAVLLMKEEVLAANVREINDLIICLLHLNDVLLIRIYLRGCILIFVFVALIFLLFLFLFLFLLGRQQFGVVVPYWDEFGAHIRDLCFYQKIRGAEELSRICNLG